MKLHVASLSLLALCLTLTSAAAVADTLYDNGPVNGIVDAYTINFGFAVSDTFTLSNNSTVNGVSFGAWLYPGDSLISAEVSITSAELGGTTYFDGTMNFSQGSCTANAFGFNVCTETGSFAGVNLGTGTYWLTLQNASTTTGDPVY